MLLTLEHESVARGPQVDLTVSNLSDYSTGITG